VSIFGMRKMSMVTAADALPGHPAAMQVPERHAVLGTSLAPPYPPGTQIAEFALGCFWGAEKMFWQTPGVVSTSVGYEGGFTPNPTYEEVCSGRTGHSETVRVVFDPAKVSYSELLRRFWEAHDPTQGMRQGNDLGTQYRSGQPESSTSPRTTTSSTCTRCRMVIARTTGRACPARLAW